MSDFISREAAIKLFNFAVLDCLGMEPTIRAGDIIKALESIPAANVRPVVRGKWILYKDRDSTGKFEYVQWSCSACKSNVRTGQPRFDRTLRERPRFNYCPNCGARMEES